MPRYVWLQVPKLEFKLSKFSINIDWVPDLNISVLTPKLNPWVLILVHGAIEVGFEDKSVFLSSWVPLGGISSSLVQAKNSIDPKKII